MAEWIYPKKPITAYEFSLDGNLKPGMLIEIMDDKDKSQYLVGHVNDLLGLCDDCHVDKEAKLIRYKVVWTP